MQLPNLQTLKLAEEFIEQHPDRLSRTLAKIWEATGLSPEALDQVLDTNGMHLQVIEDEGRKKISASLFLDDFECIDQYLKHIKKSGESVTHFLAREMERGIRAGLLDRIPSAEVPTGAKAVKIAKTAPRLADDTTFRIDASVFRQIQNSGRKGPEVVRAFGRLVAQGIRENRHILSADLLLN